MTTSFPNPLRRYGVFSEIDLHFAGFIQRRAPGADESVLLAAGLVSAVTGSGHVCLDLSAPPALEAVAPSGREGRGLLPDPHRWRSLLSSHPAVGAPGELKPLILDGHRLYLHRYWQYEQRLASAFSARASAVFQGVEPRTFRRLFSRLFPEADRLAGQGLAAATAVLKPLCVISGGPGTGKTTAAARIAALLLGLFGPERFRIRMAAPTGKAAARLKESMEAAAGALDCPEPVRRAIPTAAVTLHRLLGAISATTAFGHDRRTPLTADAVIVDEASMVDLALMAKLVDALPDHCRLVLMGDRNQLASVEAGAVLGDLCGRRRRPALSRSWAGVLARRTGLSPAEDIPLHEEAPADPSDAVVLLSRNYRFGKDSRIDRFSRRINRGDGPGALRIAERWPCQGQVAWIDAADRGALYSLLEAVLIGDTPPERAESPQKALEQAGRFKILCAVNKGPQGVDALNDAALGILRQRGLAAPGAGAWYPGRPVLILRNDYTLGLFNGDLGVTMPDPQSGELQVYFPDETAKMRAVSPFRLPDHQTAFAMTVHKSQGSEFDEVLLVLPQVDTPVLTRELIYTAVTRARRRVTVCADESIFKAAARRRIDRSSGLLEALWGGRSDSKGGASQPQNRSERKPR